MIHSRSRILLACLLALLAGVGCESNPAPDDQTGEPGDAPIVTAETGAVVIDMGDAPPPPPPGAGNAPIVRPGQVVPIGHPLRGTVLGPGKGSFVPRAEVTVIDGAGMVVASALADELGSFSTEPLHPDIYKLQVRDPSGRYFTSSLDRVDPARGDIEIEMEKGYYIAGTTSERDSRRPGAGIRIGLRQPPGGDEVGSTITGVDGVYRFGPLRTERYEIFADVEGGTSSEVQLLEDVLRLDLTVPDVFYLNGVVVRSAGSTNNPVPMAGARVTVIGADNKTVATATAGDNGMFGVVAPPPGAYSVRVVEAGGDGHGEALVTVPEGSDPRSVRVLVVGPGHISGDVKLGDIAAEPGETRLWLVSPEAPDEPMQVAYPENGRYRFPAGISPGVYMVKLIYTEAGQMHTRVAESVRVEHDDEVTIDFIAR